MLDIRWGLFPRSLFISQSCLQVFFIECSAFTVGKLLIKNLISRKAVRPLWSIDRPIASRWEPKISNDILRWRWTIIRPQAASRHAERHAMLDHQNGTVLSLICNFCRFVCDAQKWLSDERANFFDEGQTPILRRMLKETEREGRQLDGDKIEHRHYRTADNNV
jgi:hypothetical protein